MVFSPSVARFALVVVALVSVAGCHVVTDTELAQIRSQGQHQGPDPEKILNEQLIPLSLIHI